MKRTLRAITALMLLIIIAISAAGCQKHEPMPPEDMQALAMEVVDLLCEGKIEEAFAATTSSLQYIMTYDNFDLSWRGGIQYSGELTENLGVVADRWDSNEVYVVDVGLDFSKIGVLVRFLFNEYGEMTMFSLTSHDFHDDTLLPAGVTEKDITITTDTGITLHGKITLPEGSDLPGAVLIPGSGATDMDCSYGNIKVMRDIAYGLAEQGVASIRISKRTYETTQVPSLTYSFDIEYLQDYSAAYELLCAENAVDSSNVYLLGHSQGSLVAPLLDEQVNSKGLVIISGTNRYLWELVYDQNMQYLNLNPDLESLNGLNAELGKAEKLAKQAAMEAQQNSLYGTNSYYYWYQVHNMADLTAIEKPVLLMRGLGDYMTYQEDWNSLLKGYANADLTAIEYEGLSHTLTPATGSQNTADYFVDAHVDAGAISDIAGFINGH